MGINVVQHALHTEKFEILAYCRSRETAFTKFMLLIIIQYNLYLIWQPRRLDYNKHSNIHRMG